MVMVCVRVCSRRERKAEEEERWRGEGIPRTHACDVGGERLDVSTACLRYPCDHEHHLDAGDARRSDNPLVVTVHHHHDANRARGDAPRILIRNRVFALVVRALVKMGGGSSRGGQW